jgi:hypothetical protein
MKTGMLVGLVVSGLLISLVKADEPQLPPMKDGLWETHTVRVTQNKTSDTSMKMCQSRELEQSMKAKSQSMRAMNQCTEVVTQQSAHGYTAESHCEAGALKGATTKITMSVEGDTAMHMEMRVSGAQADSVTTTDSHYVGACPADMKPGDVVLPNGSKMGMGAH